MSNIGTCIGCPYLNTTQTKICETTIIYAYFCCLYHQNYKKGPRIIDSSPFKINKIPIPNWCPINA